MTPTRSSPRRSEKSAARRTRFPPVVLKNLRDEHTRTLVPTRALAAQSLTLERRLSDLVNEAYHLTPEEITLRRQTSHAEDAV